MKPLVRGIAAGALQCLLVLSVFGKYALDRERLPRVWAKAAPIDPSLPVRGRYVSLRLEVDSALPTQSIGLGHLTVRDGRLAVVDDGAPAESSSHVRVLHIGDRWTLYDPVAFFLPEHAEDPSRVPKGKELWVEVSVPRKGPPRPIRLEVR